MNHRSIATTLLAVVAACCALAAPATALSVEEAQSKLSTAESKADSIKGELDPVVARVHAEEHQAEAEKDRLEKVAKVGIPYHQKVVRLTKEIEESREDAAAQIKEAKEDHADKQDSHDRDVLIGLIVLAAGIVLGLAILAVRRFSNWKLQRWQLLTAGGAAAVLALAGIVLIIAAPSPGDEPAFSGQLVEEAEAAGEDPAKDPTPELAAALKAEKPYQAQAIRIGHKIQHYINGAESAAEEADEIEKRRQSALEDVRYYQGRVDAAEAEVEKEENFKAKATTIDYQQLIKDPSRYVGEKVVYTGQIFQIQEGYGENFMLLSVTDEGYGFWTDEIWVDGAHTNAVEEDIITVYGTVTGAESYETQIGGSNFVPKIKAKYIEE